MERGDTSSRRALARDTLTNRNDDTRSDEDADLAEIDLVLVMV
jgi:hypothetical protein